MGVSFFPGFWLSQEWAIVGVSHYYIIEMIGWVLQSISTLVILTC
jgi:hypothetical protein